MIRFACPPGVKDYDITFKNTLNWRGRAYPCGTGYHVRTVKRGGRSVRACPPLIVIGVKRGRLVRRTKPMRWHGRKGYLPSVNFTWEETVLHLIAHEQRHLWQRRVPRGHRVWGARGQYSERDADAYAIQVVRRWRRR